MRSKAVETASDRRAMAGDAGWGAISLLSVGAGVLVAVAAATLVGLAAWAVATWIGVDTTMSASDWRRLGEIGGIGAAIVLLVAFVAGGYTAGRMARRGGVRNGLTVALIGLALAAGIGAAAGGLGAWSPITREVQRLGAPSTWQEWRNPAFVAGIASILAVLIGAVAGGRMGERWHAKLLARALDPKIGPEAELRAKAAVRDADAEEAHRAAAIRVDTTRAAVTAPATVSGVTPDSASEPEDDMTRDDPQAIRQEAEHPA